MLLVFFFSPVGKVVAESVFNKKQNNDLLNKFNQLNKKVEDQEEEIQKLREIVIFNEDRIKKVESPEYVKIKRVQEQKENT